MTDGKCQPTAACVKEFADLKENDAKLWKQRDIVNDAMQADRLVAARMEEKLNYIVKTMEQNQVTSTKQIENLTGIVERNNESNERRLSIVEALLPTKIDSKTVLSVIGSFTVLLVGGFAAVVWHSITGKSS